MLQITAAQQEAVARDYRKRLAVRLANTAGVPHETPRFRSYVEEAVQAGVHIERDVAELALLLKQIDDSGRRPKPVTERLQDPQVSGDLKVFQVRYAWRKAQGLVP